MKAVILNEMDLDEMFKLSIIAKTRSAAFTDLYMAAIWLESDLGCLKIKAHHAQNICSCLALNERKSKA